MVLEKGPSIGIGALSGEIVRRINTNTRRIRTIEQRLDGLESRIGALEEKLIDELDNLRKSFDQISVDIKAVSETLSEIRGEILKINKSMDKTAKKAEIKELETLLDIYNPIKSKFITREQVERILEEKIGKKT